MPLAAIRQAEDNGELLEKTVLKLRLDQKGNRKMKWIQYIIKKKNKKPERFQAFAEQLTNE